MTLNSRPNDFYYLGTYDFLYDKHIYDSDFDLIHCIRPEYFTE
jgi:hypothetical protein